MNILQKSLVLVAIGCTCLFVYRINAQSENVAQSEQFLSSHAPLSDPLIARSMVDSAKRDAAEKLFAAQIRAINELHKSNDSTAIDILIPFLHYTTNDTFTFEYSREKTDKDINTLSKIYPAFGAIVSNPSAGNELTKYISDTKNPIDYRLAALHVLRYIDKQKFKVALAGCKKEMAAAGPLTKKRLNALGDEGVSYQGIIPVQPEL